MKTPRSSAMIDSNLMFVVARQGEGDSAPDRLAQSRRTNMASPYQLLERGAYSGFELPAANQPGGEQIPVTVLSLQNEFAPVCSLPHRNNEFTVQPSNSPMGRTK